MSIWKLLGLEKHHVKSSGVYAETDSVRRIVEALDQMDEVDPERARYVAAFAYLLGRVARADLHTSREETLEMERIIKEKSQLPEQEAILVVEIAKSQNRLFGGTENFLVGEEFNRIASREQKLVLLHCLYAVAAADESISTMEDNEISKIVNELGLTHDDLVNARLEFRDYLAVLKKPATGSPGSG